MPNTQRNEVKINQHLLNEIILDENFKKMRACIQCGECSAGCPSGNWSPLRARKIIRKALTGAESVLSDMDIWLCSTCYNCYERCPRNIPVTDIIIKLRNMAVREGYMLDPLKLVIRNLVEFGHAVPIGGENSNWAKLRQYHYLERVPPTVHKFPDALDEVSRIIYQIKFNQRVPYR